MTKILAWYGQNLAAKHVLLVITQNQPQSAKLEDIEHMLTELEALSDDEACRLPAKEECNDQRKW